MLEILKATPLREEASRTLGDVRRTRRHQSILESTFKNASQSFPNTFAEARELEAFYRFCRNPNVDSTAVLSGHVVKTASRAAEFDRLLVCHDTSEIRYPLLDEDWLKADIARTSTKTQGYELHASLLVGEGDVAAPLGVIDSTPFVHRADVAYCAEVEAWWNARGGLFANESQRWFDGVQRSAERLGESAARAIHVMDREADQFCLLHWLQRSEFRYIIRAKHLARPVIVGSHGGGAQKRTKLTDALTDVPYCGKIVARLGFRSPFRSEKHKKAHPARKERTATLHVRAVQVSLIRGKDSDLGYYPGDPADVPKTLQCNLVEVIERHPPAGQKPVRWVLLTDEPINTVADMIAVVDSYRRRWIIEEYFKALKTGCALEKRQNHNASTLLTVLAVLMPVAWALLLTRTLSAQGTELPWHFLLTPTSFKILRRATSKYRLGPSSTASDVMLAIAALGGHLRRNGPPGWRTIQRGMDKLALLTLGAELAQ